MSGCWRRVAGVVALLAGGHGAALALPGTGNAAGSAAAAAAATLQWRLDRRGLVDAEAHAVYTLFEEAVTRMPPAWRDGRHPPVDVAFRDDLPEGVHGRALGGRITLPRALLQGWMSRDRGAGVADPRARAALAAVLHEFAHVRDRTAGSALSGDPRLRDLAGWQRQPLRPWRGRNGFVDRSPDAYERASPAEFVAVNVEHFLLDPAYGCRRPALYRHLADALAFAPAVQACAPGLPLVQGSALADGGDARPEGAAATVLTILDPARVHAVEYLLAGGDEGGAGRFGHTMLRLVVCAPGRPRGPECRYDLAHHLVLSFRAQVDDVQVSNWRGLTGDYPSRLYVLPMERVVDDYTRVQLRDLRSLPLALSDVEVALLLERVAALHWSYDGRYGFVGNNCAVETWKLLHDAVPRLAATRLRSVTPKGLLGRLARTGIADVAVLDDDAQALRLGHRFASAAEQFDALYAVARRSAALPGGDAGDWIAMPASARAPYLDAVDLRGAAALLVLEHAAARRQEALAADVLKRRLLRAAAPGAGDDDAADALASVRALLRDADALSRPATLLSRGAGYGLPQQAERAVAAQQAGAVGTRLQGLADILRGNARRVLPRAQRQELDAAEANLGRLGVRLRALAHAQPASPASRMTALE